MDVWSNPTDPQNRVGLNDTNIELSYLGRWWSWTHTSSWSTHDQANIGHFDDCSSSQTTAPIVRSHHHHCGYGLSGKLARIDSSIAMHFCSLETNATGPPTYTFPKIHRNSLADSVQLILMSIMVFYKRRIPYLSDGDLNFLRQSCLLKSSLPCNSLPHPIYSCFRQV